MNVSINPLLHKNPSNLEQAKLHLKPRNRNPRASVGDPKMAMNHNNPTKTEPYPDVERDANKHISTKEPLQRNKIYNKQHIERKRP